MAAIVFPGAPASKRYPKSALAAEAATTTLYSPRMYALEWPAFFLPAAAERPSGTLLRNTATTNTQLTVLHKAAPYGDRFGYAVHQRPYSYPSAGIIFLTLGSLAVPGPVA
jgi:hypothetical protein